MFRRLVLFSIGFGAGALGAFVLSGCQDRISFNPFDTSPVTSEVAPVDTGN